MRLFRHHPHMMLVALFALAVQGAASFGHVHLARAAAADLPLVCRTVFKPAPDLPCPAHHRHEKDCSICWSVAQAGTALLPAPPVMTVPVALSAPGVLPMPAARPMAMTPLAFEARGPPADPARA